MTLAERHERIVRLNERLTDAERLAHDVAVGEVDGNFDDAHRKARAAAVALLTALASMTPAELRQGPARGILLSRIAVGGR